MIATALKAPDLPEREADDTQSIVQGLSRCLALMSSMDAVVTENEKSKTWFTTLRDSFSSAISSDNFKSAVVVGVSAISSVGLNLGGVTSATVGSAVALARPDLAPAIIGGLAGLKAGSYFSNDIAIAASGSVKGIALLESIPILGGAFAAHKVNKFLKELNDTGIVDLAWYPITKALKSLENIRYHHKVARSLFRLAAMATVGLLGMTALGSFFPALVATIPLSALSTVLPVLALLGGSVSVPLAHVAGLLLGSGIGAWFAKQTSKIIAKVFFKDAHYDSWQLSEALKQGLGPEAAAVLSEEIKDELTLLDEVKNSSSSPDEKETAKRKKFTIKEGFKRLKALGSAEEVVPAVRQLQPLLYMAIKPHTVAALESDKVTADVINNMEKRLNRFAKLTNLGGNGPSKNS
jgi:hypothetical protein